MFNPGLLHFVPIGVGLISQSGHIKLDPFHVRLQIVELDFVTIALLADAFYLGG